MSGETDFYLEAKSIEPPRSSRRPTWTRRDVLGPRLVGDLIIVRRRFRPSYPQIPPWLLRGVLTTVVIATIGFSLQRLLLPPPEGASGPATVGLWPSTVPGAYGAAPGELAALAPDQQALQPISRQAAIALNNSIPFTTAPIPAATPFVLAAASEQDRDRAAECLAQAIYYEAGGDTPDDQRAVAQVVLNRVRHPLFPKTVCGVVFQGSQLKTGCQFTFTCDGSMSRVPDPHAWARAQVMAVAALNGAVFAPVGYATHFHTPWVAPYWAPTLEKIVQIGGHLFYRWPGGAGAPRAFGGRYAGGEMAGDGAVGVPVTGEAPIVIASEAPAPAPEAPVAVARKIDVTPVALPLAAPVVNMRTTLVAAPPRIVFAAGPSLTARSYHPPIPRGGSAQPLLSHDR